MKQAFTPKDLSRIFRRKIENWALTRAEQANKIPRGELQARGKKSVRLWKRNQLPEIGNHFGWLKPATHTPVISVFMPKSGVGKTTLAATLAKTLALNGRKTLVIGIDVQGSITDLLAPEKIKSLREIQDPPGLLDLFESHTSDLNASAHDLIHRSDSPTLDFIPESRTLNSLSTLLESRVHSMFWLKDALQSLSTDYEAIIIDTKSHFAELTKSALLASNHVIVPMSCDLQTFRLLPDRMEQLRRFLSDSNHSLKTISAVPTLKENTPLSTEIEANYRAMFPKITTLRSIRRSFDNPERLENFSLVDSDPQYPLAEDYFDVISEVWRRISMADQDQPHQESGFR